MSEINNNLIELTASIVAAYVAQNSIPRSELGDMIGTTFAALAKLGSAPAAPSAAALVPATSIRKSITPDFLICLDDGLKFRSLKRHLSKLGMTPDEYRRKWNLPSDYPMVAPAYAEQRSALAKSMNLGRRKAPAPEPADAPLEKPKRASRAKVKATA